MRERDHARTEETVFQGTLAFCIDDVHEKHQTK